MHTTAYLGQCRNYKMNNGSTYSKLAVAHSIQVDETKRKMSWTYRKRGAEPKVEQATLFRESKVALW